MRIFSVPVIAALSLALMSCAANKNVPSYADALDEVTGQNGRACVRTDDIDGYGVLTGDVISIDSDFNYYLATVLPGCMDLGTSIGAVFQSDFYELCGQSMERIYTGDDRCTINKVYEFESRDEAFEAYNRAKDLRQQSREVASD